MKINEWLADESMSADDFVELYNPRSAPIALGGMYLTDNPITQSTTFQFPPLSFIFGDGL